MEDGTTIQVSKEMADRIKSFRLTERESYDEILSRKLMGESD